MGERRNPQMPELSADNHPFPHAVDTEASILGQGTPVGIETSGDGGVSPDMVLPVSLGVMSSPPAENRQQPQQAAAGPHGRSLNGSISSGDRTSGTVSLPSLFFFSTLGFMLVHLLLSIPLQFMISVPLCLPDVQGDLPTRNGAPVTQRPGVVSSGSHCYLLHLSRSQSS